MGEIEPIYISLQEATQYCNYSQEYLSLRARQGKLRAVKFGRSWLTKKEWLEEYLRKVEVYKNKKVAFPPENLPIGELRKIQIVPRIRFGFILTLVFVLLIAGIVFALQQAQGNPELTEWIGSKESFKYFLNLIKEFNKNIEKTFPEMSFLAVVNAQDILEITIDTFKEFGQWLTSLF